MTGSWGVTVYASPAVDEALEDLSRRDKLNPPCFQATVSGGLCCEAPL
jgi:hypothetical protein